MLFKITEKTIRKCFWTKEKETRVKFNPGLSANRPSNNWVQVSCRTPTQTSKLKTKWTFLRGISYHDLSSTDYHHSALLLRSQFVFCEGQKGSLILLHTFRPIVETVGNAIHWMNHYPGDKFRTTNYMIHWLEFISWTALSTFWPTEASCRTSKQCRASGFIVQLVI